MRGLVPQVRKSTMLLLLQQSTGEQQKLGTGGVGAAGDTVGQHTHGRDGETGAR